MQPNVQQTYTGECIYKNSSKSFESNSLGKTATPKTMQANSSFTGSPPNRPQYKPHFEVSSKTQSSDHRSSMLGISISARS
jgi:hypothetical protein